MDTSTTRTLTTTEGPEGLLRELSPAERWYWIIDQLSTLNVSARVRVDGELSTEALRTALDALRARHPYLRLAIADEASGPRFFSTDNPIPLREVHSDEVDDTRWAREVDVREFAEPIDWRSGPLARAVVLRQPGEVSDLIISIPHCIADGTTALALLRQWVQLSVEPPAAHHDHVGDLVPPPVEALFPTHHREMSDPPDNEPEDEPEAGSESEPAYDGQVGRFVPDRFVPFDQRRTRMLHRAIDGDALENLVLACRRQGVTMHGVLAAAVACAVARDAGAEPRTPFAVGSPVDFRDELTRPVTEHEVGCYVSAVHSVVDYQPDDLWSMARFVNRDIAERRRRGEQYPVFSLLASDGPRGVADSEPFVRYIEEHGSFNFFVSNIGRFEFPDAAGGLRLSGAQFVGGISVVGYFASSVSTCHDQLSWNFTYIDDAVSRERAERIVDDCVATVLAAADAVTAAAPPTP